MFEAFQRISEAITAGSLEGPLSKHVSDDERMQLMAFANRLSSFLLDAELLKSLEDLPETREAAVSAMKEIGKLRLEDAREARAKGQIAYAKALCQDAHRDLRDGIGWTDYYTLASLVELCDIVREQESEARAIEELKDHIPSLVVAPGKSLWHHFKKWVFEFRIQQGDYRRDAALYILTLFWGKSGGDEADTQS